MLVEGTLQNQGGVVHVKAARVAQLDSAGIQIRSHDFH
jgi:hypothetical protein